jgi:hypothetical protein
VLADRVANGITGGGVAIQVSSDVSDVSEHDLSYNLCLQDDSL